MRDHMPPGYRQAASRREATCIVRPGPGGRIRDGNAPAGLYLRFRFEIAERLQLGRGALHEVIKLLQRR
jgi:hypothetical protein